MKIMYLPKSWYNWCLTPLQVYCSYSRPHGRMTRYSVVVLILVLLYEETIKVNAEIAGTAPVRQISTKENIQGNRKRGIKQWTEPTVSNTDNSFPKLEDVKHPASVKKERVRGNGCGCKNYSCACCAHLDVEKIGLNDAVCINMTYLPDQYGVSLTISVDNAVYFSESVSARNPPPVCAVVPHLKFASLCAEFYNLTVSTSKFAGCVLIVAEGLVGESKIGCF